uniref:Uncharacterized protein n=1 Tax=Panagrolaimus sp. ES5 TaxID=591445 RepID=A0AC34G393_9BILA
SQRLSPVNLLAEFLTCDDSKNDSKNNIDSENENDLRSHSSSEGYGTQKDPFQLSSRAFDDKSAPFSSPKYSQRQQKEYGNFQSGVPSKSEEVINEYIHTPSKAVPSKYRQYSSVRRSQQRYDQKPGNQSRPYY